MQNQDNSTVQEGKQMLKINEKADDSQVVIQQCEGYDRDMI